jgi:uncharacterized protein YegP (UPF0339 family)
LNDVPTTGAMARDDSRRVFALQLWAPPGGSRLLETTAPTSEANMAGKFVIKKTSNGQYRFNLKAGNGEVIATSETYTTKAAAEKGIASVKANAPGATTDDQTGE